MSLRLKILIAIVSGMGLLLVVLISLALLESRRRSKADRDDRLRWTRQMVEAWLEETPLTADEVSLGAAMRPLFAARALAGYGVFGVEGETVRLHDPGLDPESARRYEQAAKSGEKSTDFVTRALALEDNRQGVLVVRIDAPAANPESSSGYVLAMFWTMVLGTAAIVFALFLLLHSFFLAPLASLLDASRRIALGDYSPALPPPSRVDEMGQLATAFRYMLEEIRAYHEEQESRIREATEQIRQAERSLVATQRLAATGTLAAGIAHEINNPIGGMMNAAYWILHKGDEDRDRRRQYAQLILEGLGRVQETVKKVLQFSPRALERRSTSIHVVAERARALVEHRLIQAGIDLVIEIPHEFPEVVIDPLEIQQVFLNLFLNAADASRSGGRIQVTGSVSGNRATLAVRDDGAGMLPEVASRAMDLFFTTKEAGKGTGLGLSIVHNIVTNHGGQVEIDSEPGRGTIVRFTLPI